MSEEDEAEYNGDVKVDTKEDPNPNIIPSPLCDCLLVNSQSNTSANHPTKASRQIVPFLGAGGYRPTHELLPSWCRRNRASRPRNLTIWLLQETQTLQELGLHVHSIDHRATVTTNPPVQEDEQSHEAHRSPLVALANVSRITYRDSRWSAMSRWCSMHCARGNCSEIRGGKRAKHIER